MARLRPLPFRQVKRRLEAVGFAEISKKGSHIEFARQTESATDIAMVPRKHGIPIGTLRSILNQAYIDPDDWDALG